MYRANLYLHPHTHHTKSSTVPGAYPSAVTKGTGNTDFTRTIQLTADKPYQGIGRSSRNEAKGLFAAPNNGFFESPVMSRAHAEVRIVLEPRRKIIIQDTKSMHGTFVNGLQLRPNETSELQQGTEVTFGAEVTRGDDVYPAKTFRCEVEWERLRSPSPRPVLKPRGGYGVSSVDLEYESNEGEEDFDEDDDIEENSEDDQSSGASSPAASILAPTIFEKSASVTNQYMRIEDIPVSHERSTRDSLRHLNTVFEAKSTKIKDIIDRERQVIDLPEEDAVANNGGTRPRMPTIYSLVNKTQSENVDKNIKIVDLVTEGEGDGDEDELKIIEKPASFAETNSQITGQGLKPTFIDIEESDSDSDDDNYSGLDLESVSGEAEHEGNRDRAIEDESESPVFRGHEISENKVDAAPRRGTVPASEPSSPPDVMSSKPFNPTWPRSEHIGSFITTAGEVPSLLPPIGRLSSNTPDHLLCAQQAQQQIQQQMQQLRRLQQQTQRSISGGYHTRWQGGQSSNHRLDMSANFMDSKREFFDARAKNFDRLRAELKDAADPPNVLSRAHAVAAATQMTTCPAWLDNPETNSLTSAPNARPKEAVAGSSVNVGCKANRLWGKNNGIMEREQAEDKGKGRMEGARASDEILSSVEIGDYDNVAGYEYYCELSSDDEDAGMPDGLDNMFEDEPPSKSPEVDSHNGERSRTGYSKFSIDDMMNHESPKGRTATPSATALASPLGESSTDGLEKTKAVPALENILNPAGSATPLKRKRSSSEMLAPVARVTPVIADQDLEGAPEVVGVPMIADYPELVGDQPGERSTKRVKSDVPRSDIVKLATAAMAGVVMGGVGMFAALVATAQ